MPGLNQYWHPWLLGGTASGSVEVDGDRWQLTGAQVYGEKNWGRGGFPESWWWGQAQGFADADACVAFAGGEVYAGPLRTEVTGLVVRRHGSLEWQGSSRLAGLEHGGLARTEAELARRGGEPAPRP